MGKGEQNRSTDDRAADRKARLASALRANLHRRKAQARARQEADSTESKTGTETATPRTPEPTEQKQDPET